MHITTYNHIKLLHIGRELLNIWQNDKTMLKLKGMNDTMELTIALALSILGSVISVCSFVLNRKDKSNKDIKGEIKCLMR